MLDVVFTSMTGPAQLAQELATTLGEQVGGSRDAKDAAAESMSRSVTALGHEL